MNQEYLELLNNIKSQIYSSRNKAVIAVNSELVKLYWYIGRKILDEQTHKGWGSKVIDILSKDLKKEFPEMKGFSTRNLKYRRKFAETYSDIEFVQQVAAQIPWFHNCIIIDKINDTDERNWYIQQTIENGWSRNVLVMQIETDLKNRIGKADTNFKETLTDYHSDLANESLKDPYIFDFLSIGKDAHEREIEKELVKHITKFLLELGSGFAFVGNQYRLEVGGEEFFIDLLFYHLKLRCYVVIELKSGDFKPEHAGKLNFYLSAVDSLLKSDADNPSIGLILCKSKNKLVAEYSLKDISKPVGISEYKLIESIPEEFKTSLPSIEDLEQELAEVGIVNNE